MSDRSQSLPRPGTARLVAVAAAAVLTAAGCGKEGPPLPPIPRGPLAPHDVLARQIGGSVQIGFGVPAARGTSPVQQPVRAEVLRVVFPEGIQPPTDAETFRRRGELVASHELPAGAAGARITLADSQLGTLPEGGLGSTLRYAVRVRDRKGRPSPLVVARDLVPLRPAAAPSGLRAEPTSAGVRLEWDEVPAAGDQATTYNVYRASPGGERPIVPLNPEPISATSFLDSGAAMGHVYVYEVRVALAEGLPYREGESSAEIEVLARDDFAPAAPTGLVAVQEGPAVRLFWDPNDERDLAGYRLYRSRNGEPWQTIHPEPIERAQYLDTDVTAGDRPSYRLTAVDRAAPPNESEPSEAVEVELRAEPGAAEVETP